MSDITISEKEKMIKIIQVTFKEYLNHGPRSSKKTDCLHEGIKDLLQNEFPNYTFKIEEWVDSENESGKKKCDIVGFTKLGNTAIVFPVKFIMTNYKQNKNNNWENLTGEVLHIKKAIPEIHVVPINIIFNSVPYCESNKIIKKYEKISYEKSYKITEKLKEWELSPDIINYIIDVEHLCQIGEKYDKCPRILNFNEETPYRTLSEILTPLLIDH